MRNLSAILMRPLVNCLAFPLGIYGLVLNAIAVKAVHQFSWGRALAASFALLAVALLCLLPVFVIVVLAILGPAIGNIFSNIVNEI